MPTVGLELEWSDVDRHAILPERLGKWSTEDYSVVNSDGHANDPTGATWRWGGEVNTRPTETVAEQLAIVRELRDLLKPTVNFKSNLHVHVQPSCHQQLLTDVDMLKRFATYLRLQERFVYEVVDPLPYDQLPNYSGEALKGARKRLTRNKASHHYSLPPERWLELCEAKIVQEVKDAHAPPTYTGGRAWHVAQRPGMNLRSLWKHGTIEYRHFFGTLVLEEIECAMRWCVHMTLEAEVAAFGGQPRRAEDIYEEYGPWRFPRPMPYDHELMLGFQRTKFK